MSSTSLDGVCVSSEVADYVACVRARGATLRGSSGRQLDARAEALGVQLGGGWRVYEDLWREYEGSDATALAVIQACTAFLPSRAAEASALDIAGTWTSSFENGGETPFALVVTQVGDRVTAVRMAEETIAGLLHGRVLSGIWTEAGKSGRFRLEFSADTRTFSGTWGYGTSDGPYAWTGRRFGE